MPSPRDEQPDDDGAYGLSEGVILVPVRDGSARLLDLDGRFYAVSAIGAQMLQETLARGPAAAVQQIANRYAVNPRQVQTDLRAFLDALKAQRLVGSSSARPGVRRPRVTPASLLVGPALDFVNRFLRPWDIRARVLLPLASLSLRVFGWTRTVAVWTQCRSAEAGSVVEGNTAAIVKAIDEAVSGAVTKHLSLMTCRERALSCWTLARAAGLPATIVVGINLFPLAAHCWCESGPWTLGDDPDFCKQYIPVARYEASIGTGRQ